VGRQFGCKVEKGEFPVRPFPGTWNLDLIHNGRSQLLLLASEEYSLFTTLFPTRQVRKVDELLSPLRSRLLRLFDNSRVRMADRPDLNEVTFSRRTDPRIVGSQNDLVWNARFRLDEAVKPASPGTLLEIEEELNSMPMSYLAMERPCDVFKQKNC
jgi:hypothetical protein